MNNYDELEKQLNQLTFETVKVNDKIVNKTIKKIKHKDRFKNLMILGGLFALSIFLLVMMVYLYFYNEQIHEFIKYIIITLLVVSYNYLVLSSLYYFKILKFLKMTFKVNYQIN